MFNFNTAIHMPIPAGQPANGRHKNRTKNIFFCEKNAVGHATFAPLRRRKYQWCKSTYMFF